MKDKFHRSGLCLEVPMYIDDGEYFGDETGTQLKCRHGLRPKRRTAWEGKDTGRRFLGCPLEEEDQCDALFWVDEEWQPRIQKAFEMLWLALDHASTRNPTKAQYQWSNFVDRTIVEEDKMKLEFQMASQISAIEAKHKKRVSRIKKETEDLKAWLMGSLVVIAFLLFKIIENMYQGC
uniref:GRF-type domain-containing protein n=1 Tax=Oryza nivara TaxID=4536 RepID=A0A0E0ILU8_ORYNI